MKLVKVCQSETDELTIGTDEFNVIGINEHILSLSVM
jgi:hypothetical protein